MNRHKTLIKSIAIAMVCLFTMNTIAWAYPDKLCLAVQSVFKPIDGRAVRDIGMIRYFLQCMARAFPSFEAIPGDVNTFAGTEGLGVTLSFSQISEYKSFFGLGENDYVVPCNINKARYYAYVSLQEKEISALSVFTEEEFAKLKEKNLIVHRKRGEKDEKDIAHEEGYDAPLTVAYTGSAGARPIPRMLRDSALQFFEAFGASVEFIDEARTFMESKNAVHFVRKEHDLILTIDERVHRFPDLVKIEKAHASNDHINIPFDVYDDMVRILVHELAAKCGLPHTLNEQLDSAYGEWERSFTGATVAASHPDLTAVVAQMRFVDLKTVEGRDLSKEKDREPRGMSSAFIKLLTHLPGVHWLYNRLGGTKYDILAAPFIESVFIGAPLLFGLDLTPLTVGIAMTVFTALHIFNIDRAKFEKLPPRDKIKALFRVLAAPVILSIATVMLSFYAVPAIELIRSNIIIHFITNCMVFVTKEMDLSRSEDSELTDDMAIRTVKRALIFAVAFASLLWCIFWFEGLNHVFEAYLEFGTGGPLAMYGVKLLSHHGLHFFFPVLLVSIAAVIYEIWSVVSAMRSDYVRENIDYHFPWWAVGAYSVMYALFFEVIQPILRAGEAIRRGSSPDWKDAFVAFLGFIAMKYLFGPVLDGVARVVAAPFRVAAKALHIQAAEERVDGDSSKDDESGFSDTSRGPALFVHPKTGRVRELWRYEHWLANRALKKIVFEEGDGSLARKLRPMEVRALVGKEYFDAMHADKPPLDVYIVNDEALRENLPRGFKYIAGALLTHAGRYKGQAKNLFIPCSVYNTLLFLESDSEELAFWRAHELEHIQRKRWPHWLSRSERTLARNIFVMREQGPLAGMSRARPSQYAVLEQTHSGDLTTVYRIRVDEKEYTLELPRSGTSAFAHIIPQAKILRSINPEGDVSCFPKLVALAETNLGEIIGIITEPVPPGMTLLAKVKKELRLLTPDAIDLTIGIAEMLKNHLHNNNIIHRDISPEEIHITHEGEIMLIDFDLAAPLDYDWETDPQGLREDAAPLFTPNDVMEGAADPDFSDDAFGLATTLYYMLMGEELVSPGGLGEIDHRISAIIEKATHPARSKRYHDMDEMLADLKECRDSLGGKSAQPALKVSGEILPEDLESRFRGEFAEERAVTWDYEGEHVEARMYYDVLLKKYIVIPDEAYKKAHKELEILDMPAMQQEIAPEGSFGQIIVRFLNIDGKEVLLFHEVHPSRGCRKIRPHSVRHAYRPWAENAIREMISVAKMLGVETFYASTPERIKEMNKKYHLNVHETNLWENYELPFANKGWSPVVVDLEGEEGAPLWKREEETAQSPGPALFVDQETGKVRELRPDEHKVLNKTLALLVGNFKRDPDRGYSKKGVRALTEEERVKLAAPGSEEYSDEESFAEYQLRVYSIDDRNLERALPVKYRYIARGLITHAGRWRSGSSRKSHYNLFIPRSIYRVLSCHLGQFGIAGSVAEQIEDFWRQHEIEHLRNRKARSDRRLTAKQMRFAKKILDARDKMVSLLGDMHIMPKVEQLDEAQQRPPLDEALQSVVGLPKLEEAVRDMKSRLDGDDIPCCSALRHGVPLARVASGHQYKRFVANLKVLEKITRSLASRDIDPLQTLTEARRYFDSVSGIIKTAKDFDRYLQFCSDLCGLYKEVRDRGYSDLSIRDDIDTLFGRGYSDLKIRDGIDTLFGRREAVASLDSLEAIMRLEYKALGRVMKRDNRRSWRIEIGSAYCSGIDRARDILAMEYPEVKDSKYSYTIEAKKETWFDGVWSNDDWTIYYAGYRNSSATPVSAAARVFEVTDRAAGTPGKAMKFIRELSEKSDKKSLYNTWSETPGYKKILDLLFSGTQSPFGTSPGPALFVDQETGKVRELRPDEHKVLNEALDTLVFKSDIPYFVGKLSAERTRELIGEDNFGSISAHGPPLDAYVVNDFLLLRTLPEDYRYLARGLITHAGTWRDDDGTPRAQNLFIPTSIYNELSDLLHIKSPVLEAWREHETDHFMDRDNVTDSARGKRERVLTTMLYKQKTDDLARAGAGTVIWETWFEERPYVMKLTANPKIAKRRVIPEAAFLQGLNPQGDISSLPVAVGVRAYGDTVGVVFEKFSHGFTVAEYMHVQSRIKEKGTCIPQDEALDIAIQVAEALQYHVHRSKVIHRDVKPNNIYVRSDGSVILCDFGISAPTSYGWNDDPRKIWRAGTPGFIPREVYQKKATPDFSDDTYALGMTLRSMLTGKKKPDAEDMQKVDPYIRIIIEKAMHPDRRERYHDIENMVTDLRYCEWSLHEGQDIEPGPALFVEADTGTARPLRADEHTVLNRAFREIAFSEKHDHGVRHLEPHELKHLTGERYFESIHGRRLPFNAYEVEDGLLDEKLPEGFKYLARGILTYAATYKEQARNLFIPASVHRILAFLDEDFDELRFWRKYEARYMESEATPSARTLNEKAQALARHLQRMKELYNEEAGYDTPICDVSIRGRDCVLKFTRDTALNKLHLIAEEEALTAINPRGNNASLPSLARPGVRHSEYLYGIVLDRFPPGKRLFDYIEEHKPPSGFTGRYRHVPEDISLDIAIRVAEILKENVHARDIVHRDSKPENIHLVDDGTVLVYDFGISASTGYDWTEDPHRIRDAQTPEFTPFDTRNKTAKPDFSDDAYALGITLYNMLTGDTKHWEMSAHTFHPKIKEVIAKATNTERSKRYHDMAEMLKDLQAARDSLGQAPSPGRALFVQWTTREVRELRPDEHEALNNALRNLVFAGKDGKQDSPAYAGKLSDEAAEELIGEKNYKAINRRGPPLDVYIIDDIALRDELGERYEYLAGGLITHAGTWRDKRKKRAHNFFVPMSVYTILFGLIDRGSPMLDAWRSHETRHFTSDGETYESLRYGWGGGYIADLYEKKKSALERIKKRDTRSIRDLERKRMVWKLTQVIGRITSKIDITMSTDTSAFNEAVEKFLDALLKLGSCKVAYESRSVSLDVESIGWGSVHDNSRVSISADTTTERGVYRISGYHEGDCYDVGSHLFMHQPYSETFDLSQFIASRGDDVTTGPVLFVEPTTEEVRELRQDEHDALNDALLEMVFIVNDPDHVQKLSEDEMKELMGDEYYSMLHADGPALSVYVIDDEELDDALPRQYSHLARGLITHAGTFGGEARNLFIPRSAYRALRLLDENFDELTFWRRHEAEHLLHRNKVPVLDEDERSFTESLAAMQDCFLDGGEYDVYTCDVHMNGKICVLKFSDDRDSIRSLLLPETKALKTLNPGGKLDCLPHIVHARASEERNVFGFAMEAFPPGVDVVEYVAHRAPGDAKAARDRHVPDREALDIIIQATRVLKDHVHAKGYMHRDIKPEHIYVKADGKVILLDFDRATPDDYDWDTDWRDIYGRITPKFAPPEIAHEDLKPDYSDDTYGLGTVLCYLLLGDYTEVGRGKIPRAMPAWFSPDIWRIIKKATHKNWEERYQTADDMLKDLQAARDSLGRGASPGPALYVEPETKKVKPLSEDGHNALNDTLNRIVFSGDHTDEVKHLTPSEAKKLIGEENYAAIEERGFPPDIYVIKDALLEEHLPGEFKHIAKGLLTHAGTYKGNARNLFMSEHMYTALSFLDEDFDELTFWRDHEAEHLQRRDIPLDGALSKEGRKLAQNLYDLKTAIADITERGHGWYISDVSCRGIPCVIKLSGHSWDIQNILIPETGVMQEINPEGAITALPSLLAVKTAGEIKIYGIILKEFEPGTTLSDYIAKKKPAKGRKEQNYVSQEEALDIAIQIAKTLEAHVHPKGIMHRDVQPENIHVLNSGGTVLYDYGISERVGYDWSQDPRGLLDVCNENYTPDDTLNREHTPDFSDDTYALGMTLLEMLTGNLRINELESAHINPAIKEIIRRSTDDERSTRYQSARAMRTDLEKCRESLSKAKTESAERADILKKKAGEATQELANALFNCAMNLQDGEKMLLALDEDLGREGTANFVKQIIRDLCGITQNETLQKILQNIIIIKGRGKTLAKDVSRYTTNGKDGIKIDAVNVMMITKTTNERHCEGFKEEAVITFVDDSKLDMMDYYPITEITLFTIAKALYHRGVTGYDAAKLTSLYRSLRVEQVAEDQIIQICIDKKTVTIILKPAEPFDYNELRDIYQSVREFLRSA